MENTLCFSTNYDSALIDRIQQETKSIGYYNLPNQDTHYIDDYLEKLDKQQGLELLTDIVVVGIGGSSLGTKAIYHFLKPVRKLKRKLHFIDSTDPIALNSLQKDVNFSSQATHFLIISKSGSTIETIAEQNNLAFVDMAAYMNQLRDNGIVVDGITFTNKYVTGNAFSTDGVHLTPQGNALIANLFIDAINTKYGSNIPHVAVSEYNPLILP